MNRIFFGMFLILAAASLHAETLTDTPTITQQPLSLTVTNCGTAVFSVAVEGNGPFTYQWQFNGTNVSPTITTVAGGGSGNPGDGGPATNASLNAPQGIAVDSSGNLFFTDVGNNRIRKVDVAGMITTVAGNGTNGFSGDGGPATNAQVSYPQGVALDRSGNLFIADTFNNCVRKVDANGIITTVAGNGTRGYSGDSGPANNAALNHPIGIALDSAGNLFIADYYNHCIRKVGINGVIMTVAGNRVRGYSGDGGPATLAQLNYPSSVALGGVGNLFIADVFNNLIRKVDVEGIITTVAGNRAPDYFGDGGPASKTALNTPVSIALDAMGELFIPDVNSIRKVDAIGVITTVAGSGGPSGYSGDGGPATSAQLNLPEGIGIDRTGNLLIADTYNNRVRKVNYLFGTTPTLTLTNVGPSDVGDYSVIVRNPYGCVTSRVASLSFPGVLAPQNFTGFVTEGRKLGLQFNGGTPGHPYVLQTATNLTPPVTWEVLATNSTDGDGVWRFGVSMTNADSPARFYRVLGE